MRIKVTTMNERTLHLLVYAVLGFGVMVRVRAYWIPYYRNRDTVNNERYEARKIGVLVYTTTGAVYEIPPRMC
jgi:hypothetical protein